MSAQSAPYTVAAFGVIGGIVLMGMFSSRPAPVYAAPAPVTVAAPAPVAAIDYAAITAAVKAGLAKPAPVAAPAPAPARKVHKVHRAAPAAPARVVYYVPAYSGCTCAL
jgi:hypothetical protein